MYFDTVVETKGFYLWMGSNKSIINDMNNIKKFFLENL